ncbi:MarR family winged helix-turn-helix transcriptional regulator [Bradyrhizobium sp. USDA 4454]
MERVKLSAAEFSAACVCLGVQRAARSIARRYDEALRSTGLTSGQFTILSSLLRDEPTPIGSLADALGLDRTTLNRNLRPLESEHLVSTVPDPADGRVRRIILTSAGRKRVEAAIPLWRSVQSDSNDRLGKTGWQTLRPPS